MPEAKQITFTYAEVAEALAEKAGLKDGTWGLYFEFGIIGANVEPPGQPMTPAAFVPILKVGIQRFDEENPMTVTLGKVKSEKGHKKVSG